MKNESLASRRLRQSDRDGERLLLSQPNRIVNTLKELRYEEIGMSCETDLEALAVDLRKSAPYFKDGWHINALQAFIRDGGLCAYCGETLLDTYGHSKTATIDHLLPRCTYPERGWGVENLVPACTTCNRIKHHYDPSEGNGKGLVITGQVRLRLIKKANEEIGKWNKADKEWEKEFHAAKPRFQEAVAKYLKCKEPTIGV
jgi:hypothetical protein